jgi:hypothetical protein
MNNMFIGILGVLTVKALADPTPHNACMGALAIGLGLTNQQTLIFFELPFVVAVCIRGGLAVCHYTVFIKLIGYGVLGLTPYIYLVIASFRGPPGGWGDMTTLEGLVTHMLRAEYGTFRLYPGDNAKKDFFLAVS